MLGQKTFEIRENDRGFEPSDTVSFVKAEDPTIELPGNFTITYITDFKQQKGYVVFSIQEHVNANAK